MTPEDLKAVPRAVVLPKMCNGFHIEPRRRSMSGAKSEMVKRALAAYNAAKSRRAKIGAFVGAVSEMPDEPSHRYEFGPFYLDRGQRVLVREGKLVPLTPKAFEILSLLVQNAGRALSKEEMIHHTWPDSFVDNSNLSQHVFQLRKALGDGAGYSYIETIPRRGYRFTQDVKRIDSSNHATGEAVSATPQTTHFSGASPPVRRWKMPLLAVATMLVGVVAVYAFFARDRIWPPVPPSVGKVMLVVLPFENLSGDPQEEYFSSGFTEELITQLGNLEPARLGVIARTSATQYKDSHKDIRQIAKELGVDYVLEGSVRREGDRVRISAQLIQAKDQTHLWAQDYDRNLRDILGLQSNVARDVASQIRLQLTPEENARLANAPPRDPEAYEQYLRGRYLWNKRNPEAYIKAIDYFQQAIARDPGYAQAYAGLADAYALLGSSWSPSIPRSEAMPEAKEAALKALQLDDSLAEAHTSLAFVMMHFEWNWPGSEKEFKRAVDSDSNYATAHEWYAYWFASQGRIDEALEQMELARKADPLSLIIMADTSEMLSYAGRLGASEQEARQATELDPNFVPAYLCLAHSYAGAKEYQAAIANIDKILALDPDDTWAASELGAIYAFTGEKDKSEAVVNRMLNHAKNQGPIAFEVAQVYSALGEKNRAFVWLEKAYEYRDGGLILLNARWEFRPLHNDPRYGDLLRRLGLPFHTP